MWTVDRTFFAFLQIFKKKIKKNKTNTEHQDKENDVVMKTVFVS